MTCMLLTIPAELKLQVAESLIPLAATSADYQYNDARALADSFERLPSSFRDLRNLSMACSDMRRLCCDLLAQGVHLGGEECHTQFVENLDSSADGSTIRLSKRAKFLSLENPAYCDRCGRGDEPHRHDVTIDRILDHFSSVITLELVNFPFTVYFFHSLCSLQALRTLSVREPDPRETNFTFIQDKHTAWPIPHVANLSIVVSSSEAARTAEVAGDITTFFERTLVTLSLKSQERGNAPKLGLLRGTNFQNPFFANLANVKHLSIGHIKLNSMSLRETIAECKGLESLAVDYRGAEGMLPLFYVIDLVRGIVGDDDGSIEMMEYDWIQLGWDQNPDLALANAEDPYVTEAKIWRRCIGSFACTLNPPMPGTNRMKTVKGFELVIASCDQDSRPMNADMMFGELSEVFRRRSPTFRHLDTIAISMSDDVPFESKDSGEELKTTVLNVCRRSLASVKKFDLNWGQFALRFIRPSVGEPEVCVRVNEPRVLRPV